MPVQVVEDLVGGVASELLNVRCRQAYVRVRGAEEHGGGPVGGRKPLDDGAGLVAAGDPVSPEQGGHVGVVVQRGEPGIDVGVRRAAGGHGPTGTDRDVVVMQGPQHQHHRGVQVGGDVRGGPLALLV